MVDLLSLTKANTDTGVPFYRVAKEGTNIPANLGMDR